MNSTTAPPLGSAPPSPDVHDPHVIDLPAVWSFDDSVPADLTARWANVSQDDMLLKDFVRSMTGAGGVLMVLAGLTALLTGSGSVWVCLCSLGFGAGALLAARRSHRQSRLGSGAVSAREIDLLLDHRTLVAFDDWTHLPADDLPREVAAARRAVALSEELKSLSAWSSESLSAHRMLVDPAEESRMLLIACREIHDHRKSLEARSSWTRSMQAPGLRAVRLEWEHRLEQTWSAVRDRLDAFDTYVSEIRGVSLVLETSVAQACLQAALLEYEPVMAARIVGHEMASENLRRLGGDAGILREGLETGGTVTSPW